MRRSWREKFDSAPPPRVEVLDVPFCGAPAGARLLIASPALVDRYVRAIPPGETRTPTELRHDLARGHGADVACPTSTSIFLRIVAELALEAIDAGARTSSVSPFWRVIEPESALAAKLSCHGSGIRQLRKAEGLQRAAA
jgi:hypothetical protein